MTGNGSLQYKDGLSYIGGFANNLFEGQGKISYPDGSLFTGEFKMVRKKELEHYY